MRTRTREKTKPQCHPNRKHYAKGLCAACYTKKSRKKKEKREVKHEPVRVTHTHEVIRAVRQQEEEKMANEKHEEKRESVAGYSGSRGEGKKVERPKDASKDAVVSDCGVTEPGQEFGGDGVTPLAEWQEKYEAVREKQAEHDEKMRERAREDAGVMITTGKGK